MFQVVTQRAPCTIHIKVTYSWEIESSRYFCIVRKRIRVSFDLFWFGKKKIWGEKMWTYIPSLRQKQTCRIQIIFSLGRGKCLLGGPECYFSDWFVYGFHADLLYLGHVNLRWMGCVIKSKILWSLLNEKMEDKKKIVRFVSFVYFSWQLLQVMSRRNWYIDTFVGCVFVCNRNLGWSLPEQPVPHERSSPFSTNIPLFSLISPCFLYSFFKIFFL